MSGATALGILVAHLFGDYVAQPHWIACEKTKRWWPAVLHGLLYTAPYALVTQSPSALLVIGGTHVVIDRYRLARFLVFAKNLLAPKRHRVAWVDCDPTTGFPKTVPAGLALAVLIVVDNSVHLLINYAAVGVAS